MKKNWSRSTMMISLTGAAALAAAGVAFGGTADPDAVNASFQMPVWGPDTFGGYATDHITIKVKPGIKAVQLADGGLSISPAFDQGVRMYQGTLVASPLQEAKNREIAEAIGLDRWYIINVPKGSPTPKMVEQFAALTDVVEIAQLPGIGGIAGIPNDPSFNLQFGMHNTGQNIQGSVGTVDSDCDAPEAWDIFTGSGAPVVLAVIDSGVYGHSEIADRLLTGWNTVLNNSTNTTDADCPHGTHCSGIAGALGNNSAGVAGINWGVQFLPVDVLTGCSGNTTDCGEGIVWAADNGATVGTMSLQYYSYDAGFEDAADYATALDVLLIAATGNAYSAEVSWPAKFASVMGVGSLNNKDQRSSFSNYGPNLDISSAGENVYSSYYPNTYTYLSGTSMACPHVSGAASLLRAYNPSLTADQVWGLLIDTADDIGAPGRDDQFGVGRMNLYNAITGTPGEPRLGLDADANWYAGSIVTVTVTNADQGDRVALFFSQSLGSTYIAQLDVTLDLANAAFVAAKLAPASGTVVFRGEVPPVFWQDTLYLQAATYQRKSNTITRIVN